MKTLYNEGRVVGLSAYESFIRQSLSDDPNASIISEKEWLASNLGSGSSLILKVSTGTQIGVHDYPLPDGTSLIAAETIHAYPFLGKCDLDESGNWAIRVTDYGNLISNKTDSHPVTPGDTSEKVPYSESLFTQEDRQSLLEYTKIIDGIVYQPGTWSEYGQHNVAVELTPDLSKKPCVRLYVSQPLTKDVLILLEGFLNKEVVRGETGLECTMDTENPEDGDFLGPQTFPWAAKVIFNMPTNAIKAINASYSRKIPKTASAVTVYSTPTIDLEASNLASYYQGKENSGIAQSVTAANLSEGNAVLGVYQRYSTFEQKSGQDYPPALYASKINATGDSVMYPVDIAAPGTVKMFTNEDEAKAYPNIVPDVYGMYVDQQNHVFIYDTDGSEISISSSVSTEKVEDSSNRAAIKSIVNSGTSSVESISLIDEDGQSLDLTGSAGTISLISDSEEQLCWAELLDGLAENKKIELLGTALKLFRSTLPNIESGTNGTLNIKGTGQSTIAGSLSVGSNYIEFNGVRFYISSTQPTDAPVGSIGIGW